MSVVQINKEMLQLMHYFIFNHQYQLIKMGASYDEIWLTNPKRKLHPIIRLSPKSIDESFFEVQRVISTHTSLAQSLNISSPLLDIHVNVKEGESDERLVQVRATSEFVDPLLEADFKGIKGAFLITPDFKEVPQTKKKTSRKKAKVKTIFNVPILTFSLLIIMIINFVLINFLGALINDPAAAAIIFGAYYKTFMVAHFEYWRLLSVGIVHISVTHLLMNGYALLNLGRLVEREVGSMKMLITFVLSVISGSMFVFVAQGNILLVGASAGLFGLLGLVVVLSFESGSIRNPQVRMSFINILLINVFISLLPGVSFLGHLGGFVAGVLYGLSISIKKSWAGLRQNAQLALAFLGFSLIFLMIQGTTLTPYYVSTDQRVLNTLSTIPFEPIQWYVRSLAQALLRFYGG
ncbi:MAG: rhomboid family intramembrane serine protease [Erysipelotrichia bacterium]|jgi:membrane associated rhomboid family serine protease|nr:rhomboid family intramembrane serine protease [Erysipelotrichia bacterium]